MHYCLTNLILKGVFYWLYSSKVEMNIIVAAQCLQCTCNNENGGGGYNLLLAGLEFNLAATGACVLFSFMCYIFWGFFPSFYTLIHWSWRMGDFIAFYFHPTLLIEGFTLISICPKAKMYTVVIMQLLL